MPGDNSAPRQWAPQLVAPPRRKDTTAPRETLARDGARSHKEKPGILTSSIPAPPVRILN
eukprot:3073066-Heterocapsa_arctica.AAC.1